MGWVLSGTVDAGADALDVTTADGATVEYPLTGPVVDRNRRVFLLDLGGQGWKTLVLLRNGQVIDKTAQPPSLLALERRRERDEAGDERRQSEAAEANSGQKGDPPRAKFSRPRIVAPCRHRRPFPRSHAPCCSIERKYSAAGLRCVLLARRLIRA